MTAPLIDLLPATPVRGSAGPTFSLTADQFVSALVQFRSQINDLAEYLDTLALAVNGSGTFTSIQVTGAGGVYGWGNAAQTNTDIGNFDDITKPAGIYRYTSTTSGTRPAAILSSYSGQILHMVQNSGLMMQIIMTAGFDTLYYRRYNAGAWTPWRTMLDDGNYRQLMPLLSGPRTILASTPLVSYEVTSVPSWVSRITIIMEALQRSGSNNFLVQVGTSGGWDQSGYNNAVSFSFASNSTAVPTPNMGSSGLPIAMPAGFFLAGEATITKGWNNTWNLRGHFGYTGTHRGIVLASARIILAAPLDRFRFLTDAGDTMNTGNISYILE